ncbi:restriction endonuclease [Pseudomonas fragi]|uniref:restriction endonuclease n=1 Tax=Pseudomonas fragi TaxID=296 RepID=UPI001F3A4A14|nr:restriction endonuclease [Pseudomonas fragi]MCF6764018.1 restriction endonuclease [Pseudomonas fragi]
MPSPIDELYQMIFGYVPKKAGTAFERLAAIATYVTEEDGVVRHDAALKGAHSGSRYQVDVLHQSAEAKTMGEAKDYTYRGGKVGRSDLQKLAGALVDLPDVAKGVFWSATDYTKPARQYAQMAKGMTGKEILLRGLRESTGFDEQGFIKSICVKGTYQIPKLAEAIWTVHLSPQGKAKLLGLISDDETRVEFSGIINDFLNSSGVKITSIFELTSGGYGNIGEDGVSRGCFWLPDHYIWATKVLVSICGLEYEIPYDIQTTTFEITDNSTYRLVVLDETGAPVRILTDEKIREFDFNSDGLLIKPKHR